MKKLQKISIFFFLISPLVPFLNGTGCDFTIKHTSENYEEIGVCKLGILDIYIKNKKNNITLYQRQLYGAWHNRFLTFNIKSSAQSTIDKGDLDSLILFYEHINLSQFFIVHRDLPSNASNEYVLYSTYPMKTISTHQIDGRLSWISTFR